MASLGTIHGVSPLDADDTTYFTFSDDLHLETTTVALDNMPSDFATMDAVVINLRAKRRDAGGDDDFGVQFAVMNAANTVVLVGNNSDPGLRYAASTTITDENDQTVTYSSPVYVNTTATKADWDGAVIYIRQTWTQSKGKDKNAIQADEFWMTGTYTPVATSFPHLSRPIALRHALVR
jgi:hypothetical protein